MFFGLMAPFSFLYERAFSMDEAIYEHTELEHALSIAGVKVHRLKRLSVNLSKENPGFLERARERAMGIGGRRRGGGGGGAKKKKKGGETQSPEKNLQHTAAQAERRAGREEGSAR